MSAGVGRKEFGLARERKKIWAENGDSWPSFPFFCYFLFMCSFYSIFK
jgi:hypothetical protein